VDQPVEDDEAGEGFARTSPKGASMVRSMTRGALMASASLASAGPKPASTSSTSGSASSPPKAAVNIVAPPIMCSSTPRTVNWLHGVG
jgi:hypothetical protein